MSFKIQIFTLISSQILMIDAIMRILLHDAYDSLHSHKSRVPPSMIGLNNLRLDKSVIHARLAFPS